MSETCPDCLLLWQNCTCLGRAAKYAATQAPPGCAECSDRGWAIFNARPEAGYFGEVYACDCGILQFDDAAWNAAIAAGVILDKDAGGQVLMDVRIMVRFGYRLIEWAAYGYTFEGRRGGRIILQRWKEGEPKMYVTNGHGNVASVKGNYTWCDSHGVLRTLSPGRHPDEILWRYQREEESAGKWWGLKRRDRTSA